MLTIIPNPKAMNYEKLIDFLDFFRIRSCVHYVFVQ